MSEYSKYIISSNSNIRDAVKKIDLGGHGFVLVKDQKDLVIGIVSDGDFRRAVLKGVDLNDPVLNITNTNYKHLSERCTLEASQDLLHKLKVEVLPVIINNELVDIITHD